MKKIVAIIVLCSLILQSLAHFSVVALFEFRKDYIVRTLCENRDKPEVRCCGKCYLNKQLKKVDEKSSDSKDNPIKVEKQALAIYLLPAHILLQAGLLSDVSSVFNPGRQCMIGQLIPDSIFHPPPLVSPIK